MRVVRGVRRGLPAGGAPHPRARARLFRRGVHPVRRVLPHLPHGGARPVERPLLQGGALSRGQVLLDWARYAGSQYIARLCTLVRGFIVARLLGPTDYGKWIALLVIYELGAYVHAGILNGMDREIPFHLGKGEKERAWAYRDSGYTAVLGFTTLFLLALVVVDLAAWRSYTPLTRFALPAAGVALLIENQIFLHYNLFRAQQRFGPPAEGWAVQGITNLALSVPLVILWQVHGLFVALVASNLITLGVLRTRADWRFRLRWNLPEKWRLLKRGAPVLAYLFVEVLLRQVDKLVIIAFLPREELGFYGIAFTV
ncbi:MAG: lipopolysaccharide biosynthesis protein, partial [Candidatus Latescibacterota bacterium]